MIIKYTKKYKKIILKNYGIKKHNVGKKVQFF